jgi:hypothetical protein
MSNVKPKAVVLQVMAVSKEDEDKVSDGIECEANARSEMINSVWQG